MKHHLPDFLRELRSRDRITVAALAQQCDLSPSVLYKAEEGRPVAWKTIQAAYEGLCRTKDESVALLARWACAQAGKETPSDTGDSCSEEVSKQIREIKSDALEFVSSHPELAPRVIRLMVELTAPQRDLFIRFAERFSADEATRDLTRVWMRTTA